MKANSDRIDRFRLDAQIQTLVAAINNADGFLIHGWFKPASDDDGTALEHKKFHVTSLTPATDLSEDQRELKYAGEPAAVWRTRRRMSAPAAWETRVPPVAAPLKLGNFLHALLR